MKSIFTKIFSKNVYVPCDFCQSTDFEPLYDRGRFNMTVHNVICRKCGLVYVNPRLDDSKIRNFYKSQYREIYSKSKEVTPDSIKDAEERAKLHVVALEPYIRKAKTVLDIGCSAGSFLKLIKDKYPEKAIKGIEANESYSNYGKVNYGLDVFTGTLENFETSNKFDFIYISHVLEHFPSPVQALTRISSLMENDGVLFIEVPTIFIPYVSLDFFFQDAHLFTFSPNSISNILKKSSFEIVSIENSGWFMRVVCRKTKENTSKYVYDNYADIKQYVLNYKHK